MAVSLKQLENDLNQLLKSEQFTDYCPNGLQVEGRSEVTRVVTGVTACKALIEAAAEQEADLLLVHHGYFWRGEDQSITGLKKSRIECLLQHQMSLIAYHLPLDFHDEFGNNVQLAKVLGFEITGELGRQNNRPIALSSNLAEAMSFDELNKLLANRLGREPFAIEAGDAPVKSLAWCTGAAQSHIQLAVDAGVDAYITGEISESTVHIAREAGLHFFAAGHHATERYGVQALGNYLAEKYSLEHQFIDIDNPV